MVPTQCMKDPREIASLPGWLLAVRAAVLAGARGRSSGWRWRRAVRGLALVLAGAAGLCAAEPSEAWMDLQKGNYADAIREASAVLHETPGNQDAVLTLVQASLAVGRNVDADMAMREALSRDSQSIRLRWLARDVAWANGRPEEAAKRAEEIRRLFTSNRWGYRTPADIVIFGRAALALGMDPKEVLERVFAVAQKADPKLREVYLARGELALEKHDFALAAKAFEEGLQQHPDDPDLHHGRARAYAGGNRGVAMESLEAALKHNPRHVPSLLQLVDFHIDAEEYTEAGILLDQIIGIHPTQPLAWAYRSAMAHLRNDPIAEKTARDAALSSWPRNPRVDHLIGRVLSRKYRFAEGAARQRRAREFDPTFLPATSQLASDLLRLGEEEEGWRLAQAVYERDDYDVEAYNLVTLRETMDKYAVLTTDDFIVRMAAPEVAVYGPRVLSLLRRAQRVLVAKYGVELERPTIIEIFADPKDFAVRTFGLPDVAGFLGVCFGRVVTANSPASSGSPTNWESVLWHEFCHVITLQMTKNKMPRWLSEGISVYEERQADPAWGMRIDPEYREMLLGEDLVPVGKLSAAFLAPKSARHLQFAYLQSSLVVEFIVERFGLAALRGILSDLREGAEINVALANNTAPLAKLEREFETYAREQAKKLAPGLDWTKPPPALLMANNETALAAWEALQPDNYWLLRARARRLSAAQKWEEARVPLERLIELYPRQDGGDTAYRPLAAAFRALGDTKGERDVLQRWVEVDDEAPDAYLRIMELAAAESDWPVVARNAERYLAVNPLVPPPYRYQAEAAAAMDDPSTAIVAWRTLLALDVPDAPEAHYQLASLLYRRGETEEARHQTLLALEETPRYRDALRLLLELKRVGTAEAPEPAPVGYPSERLRPAVQENVLP